MTVTHPPNCLQGHPPPPHTFYTNPPDCVCLPPYNTNPSTHPRPPNPSLTGWQCQLLVVYYKWACPAPLPPLPPLTPWLPTWLPVLAARPKSHSFTFQARSTRALAGFRSL
jgi:hypothetical protein